MKNGWCASFHIWNSENKTFINIGIRFGISLSCFFSIDMSIPPTPTSIRSSSTRSSLYDRYASPSITAIPPRHHYYSPPPPEIDQHELARVRSCLAQKEVRTIQSFIYHTLTHNEQRQRMQQWSKLYQNGKPRSSHIVKHKNSFKVIAILEYIANRLTTAMEQ